MHHAIHRLLRQERPQDFAGDVFGALRAQRQGRTIIGYEEMRLEVVYDPETGSFKFGNNTVGWRPLSEMTAMYQVIGDKSESPDLLV